LETKRKSVSFSFTGYMLPSLTVDAPGGSIQRCAATTIRWSSTGDSINLVDISIYIDGSGEPPILIAAGASNSGSYSWNIPCNFTTSSSYKVEVAWSDPSNTAWWMLYCKNGPACNVIATSNLAFTVTYCSLCKGNAPATQANSTLISGATTGIVIGVILAVLIAGLIVFAVYSKRKNGTWPIPSISMPSFGGSSNDKKETVGLTAVVASSSPAPQKPTPPPVHSYNSNSNSNNKNTSSSSPNVGKRPPAPPAKQNLYRIDYEYVAQSEEEVTVKAGDIVNVIKIEGDWAYGAIANKKGYFPTSYASKILS